MPLKALKAILRLFANNFAAFKAKSQGKLLMNKGNLGIAALLVAALLLSTPLGAASENVIPYVEITSPIDGQTVEGIATVRFLAEGQKLHDPSLSIDGETGGIAFPLNCEVEEPVNGDGTQKMYCQYDWNTKDFEGEKAIVTATVFSGEKVLNDKVGVYVSGERA